MKSRVDNTGGDPFCVLCLKIRNENFIEDVKHILIICKSYCNIRDNYLPKYEQLLSTSHINFKELCENQDDLCQFILDPSSMNLNKRINMNDAILPELFNISRNLCHSINVKRLEDIGSRRYQK